MYKLITVHSHVISCGKVYWITLLDMLLMPSCRPRPRTWTCMAFDSCANSERNFERCEGHFSGKSWRIDVASYGRDQSVLSLDDSQFIHCNDHSVSKLKINLSISRDYRCNSVFDWHLGTKNGPQMIDLDNQKWFFLPKYISGYPIGQFSIKVYINGKVYFGFFWHKLSWYLFPSFLFFLDFTKWQIAKNLEITYLTIFLYFFHQVLRYSKQSLENFVQGTHGRWHKILGREVTFCKKFVTSFSHQWYVICSVWRTQNLI